MPPTFKKPKDYDSTLAQSTLGQKKQLVGPAYGFGGEQTLKDRQMLIHLGLAEENEAEAITLCAREGCGEFDRGGNDGGSASVYLSPQDSSLSIGACSTAGEHSVGEVQLQGLESRMSRSRRKQQTLQLRTLEAVKCLQAGEDATVSGLAISDLLLDLSREVELLARGNGSLKKSLSLLRRSSHDREEKPDSRAHATEDTLESAKLQEVQLAHACARREAADAEGEAQEARLHAAPAAVVPAAVKPSPGSADSATITSEPNMLQHTPEAETTIAETQCQLARLQAELQAAQASLAIKAASLEKANECNRLLQDRLEELQAAEVVAAAELAGARDKEEALLLQVRQLAEVEQNMAGLHSQTCAAKNHAEAVASQSQSRLAKLEQQLCIVRDELVASQAAAEKESSIRHAAESAMESLAEKLDAALQRIQEGEIHAEAATVSAAVDCAALQSKLDCATAEKCALEASLASLKASEAMQAHEVAALHSQLEAAVGARASAEARASALQKVADEVSAERTMLQEALAEANVQRESTTEQEEVAQRQTMSLRHSEAQHQLAAAHAECRRLQEQLMNERRSAMEAQQLLAKEVCALKEEAAVTLGHAASQKAEYEVRIAEAMAAAEMRVVEYQSRWRAEFDRRRALHDALVELKGNIRVMARIRPLLATESAVSQGAATVEVQDEGTLVVRVPSERTARSFELDRVFSPEEDQDAVFGHVWELVTSALDGFNVCLMAYGQTGSGKTFTMEGTLDKPGVNTRALQELYRLAADRQAQVHYTFHASVLEIYNEQIFDLLSGSRRSADKLDVLGGPQGMHVPGLRQQRVDSMTEVALLLRKASQNRSTYATDMNADSSRSHLVLSVYVSATAVDTGTTWTSKLHLIDLAGSERISRSGAQGERLKEAQAINKSLSALGDVIQALKQRAPHIPYRNSKLTRLLEDSLGGNAKCAICVTCSPTAESAPETRCSLEFATRARAVELGAAKRAQNTVGRPPGSPASPARAQAASPTHQASQTGTGSTGVPRLRLSSALGPAQLQGQARDSPHPVEGS